jgi:phosphate transport system substrate-binding protein
MPIGKGLQIQTFDLALDGIAVVVHPNNPVEALTMENLRDIFVGVQHGWQNAGGRRYPITVFSGMDGSGTAHLFRERVLGDKDDSGIAQQMPTNEAVVAIWTTTGIYHGAYRVSDGRRPSG